MDQRQRMNSNASEYRVSKESKAYPTESEEEFAAEVAPGGTQLSRRGLGLPEEDRPDYGERRTWRDGREAAQSAAKPSGLGWTALISAFVSLFLWPSVLGPAAVILGITAYAQGNRKIGIWSAVIGVISMLAYWVLVPSYS